MVNHRFLNGKNARYVDIISTSDNNGRSSTNTVFGDSIVGIRKTSLAHQFQYGLPESQFNISVTSSGTYDTNNAMLNLSTGTSVDGKVIIETKKYVRYIPGQETYDLFTPVFDTPKENTFQRIGLFDEDNGFFIGYEGTDFVFTRRRSGVDTQYSIDVTEFCSTCNTTLDPTLGNVFKISYGYLGFATISVDLMTPTGSLHNLLTIEYPNTSKLTHIAQTYLPHRLEVGNTGNNTNLTMSTGSFAAGIVDGGTTDVTSRENAYTNTGVFTIDSDTSLVVFRNKPTFNSVSNKIFSRLLLIAGSNDVNKNVRWRIIKNPTLTNTPTWTSVDAYESIMEYSTDATIDFTANDDTYLAWNVAKLGDFFHDVEKYKLDLPPNETAGFVIETTGLGEAQLSIRWKELF